MITIVDYKAGNLTSVANAVEYLGQDFVVSDRPAAVREADRIIFPGVGAAGDAMKNLRDLELIGPLLEAVARGVPFLGICIGYQLLFEHSDEDDVDCLGILTGRVVRFPGELKDPVTGGRLKVPQMGWNHVRFIKPHPVWNGLPEGAEFYFVHSYYPVPAPDLVAGVTEYGIEFASAAVRDNVVGVQFHPEKSGRPGLRFLDNFCRWNPA